MEGLAKSAESINVTPVTVTPESTQPMMLGGVPIMMIEYFGIDHRNIGDTEKRQLNDIYEYFRGEGRQEDIYAGLRALEAKRGASNEGRIERLHRWIKISSQIKELQSRRELL
jgi:hypothetical protein